ncbi:hypothetical protein IQ238_03380 [Pleurocapsales cyanobacterium LEGE 06147]|nr:hypothetical protein [Pleurocapsales cyanobacterium LEGE 06147]
MRTRNASKKARGTAGSRLPRIPITSQQKQLQLSLERFKVASVTPPTPPVLPLVSYLEQEAAVEKAKAQLASISSELEFSRVNKQSAFSQRVRESENELPAINREFPPSLTNASYYRLLSEGLLQATR